MYLLDEVLTKNEFDEVMAGVDSDRLIVEAEKAVLDGAGIALENAESMLDQLMSMTIDWHRLGDITPDDGEVFVMAVTHLKRTATQIVEGKVEALDKPAQEWLSRTAQMLGLTGRLHLRGRRGVHRVRHRACSFGRDGDCMTYQLTENTESRLWAAGELLASHGYAGSLFGPFDVVFGH